MRQDFLNFLVGIACMAIVAIVAITLRAERVRARSTYSDTSWQGNLASMTSAAWNQAYWAKRAALAAERHALAAEKCACE